MLDLKWIRENPQLAKQGIASKHGDVQEIDAILALDVRRREILLTVERLKQQRNQFSQEVSQRKRAKADASDLIEKTRAIGQEIKGLDEELKAIESDLGDKLDRLPNPPHASVPDGKSAKDNVVIRAWGKIPALDFQISDHMEIGERLGLFDFSRGSKITGRGFPVYTGIGARLERSLINFMLDTQTGQHGYVEMMLPLLATRASLRGTSQLPKFEEDQYLTEKDDLFLIPTAEVPLTNLHRDEIMAGDQLPVRYCAYTPCFRREAGSWGKDTRGFLRLHQFNKVELVKIVNPDDSYAELETLLADACRVLELLSVPYRVIELCRGDLSFGAAKCYDIEVWSPAEETWLEVSSCSNFEAFQARRMNTRFRREAGEKPEFVHTLNGSGVATPRLLVALLEVHQQEDGSVLIPEPLRQYTGFSVLKRAI